jgi:hypothetical protein
VRDPDPAGWCRVIAPHWHHRPRVRRLPSAAVQAPLTQ